MPEMLNMVFDAHSDILGSEENRNNNKIYSGWTTLIDERKTDNKDKYFSVN